MADFDLFILFNRFLFDLHVTEQDAKVEIKTFGLFYFLKFKHIFCTHTLHLLLSSVIGPFIYYCFDL